MLTCKQFLQELNDYLDGNGGSGDQETLGHVNECPNCFVIVDTTKKTLEVYKGMEPQTLPDDLKNAIMASPGKENGGQETSLTA